MIRPANFGFNEETAASNTFQQKNSDQQQVQQQALKEFDAFAETLRANGVDVTIINDTPMPHKPDAIFPNNWVSFHNDGNVFLYPMQAENRRLERNEDVIRELEDRFTVHHIMDLSRFEHEHKYLEGTGSMVLDRENKIAYACLSPRTDAEVLNTFCEQAGYTPIVFQAVDQQGKAIYHTNVLMSVASEYAVICLESIANKDERDRVINSIEESGKEVVSISFDQMNRFAGNMLEVNNKQGKSLIVMSKSAHDSLDDDQLEALQHYSKIVSSDLSTIEINGGGSARCMLAEIFLPGLVN